MLVLISRALPILFLLSACGDKYTRPNHVQAFSIPSFSPGLASFKAPASKPKLIEKASSELVSILVDGWNTNNIGSSGADKDDRIKYLINTLVESEAYFDPNECIFGEFFMTIYFSGTTPLWEKIAQVSPKLFGNDGRKNIKGQKYYFDNDSLSQSNSNVSSNEGKVINYAEVFGKALQLRAYGTCAQKSLVLSEESTSGSPKSSPSSSNDLLSFLKERLIAKEKANTKTKELLKCPVDYIASVEKGTIVFLNNEFDIKIAGKGTVRVLYADPKMRIFVNVDDNTDARWEKDGLLVVQVRGDLVDPQWML